MLDLLLAGSIEDIDGPPCIPSKERLENDAQELTAIGLPQVAAIVAEAAERAIPGHILYCPYDPEDTYNYNDWHRGRSAALTPEADIRRHAGKVR